jgi:hypothetical protein
MYSAAPTQSLSNKNPNRVTGGLKGQGVDRFTMVAEDGSSKEIPTLEYVRSLEEQLRTQRGQLESLTKKVTKLSNTT